MIKRWKEWRESRRKLEEQLYSIYIHVGNELTSLNNEIEERRKANELLEYRIRELEERVELADKNIIRLDTEIVGKALNIDD